MDTGHNFQFPKVRKSVDLALTALGISLFIAFAAVGARQADDKKLVTGNNEQTVPVIKDVVLTAASNETYVPYALSVKTDTQHQGQAAPSAEKPQPAAQAKAIEKASVKNRAASESRIRQN